MQDPPLQFGRTVTFGYFRFGRYRVQSLVGWFKWSMTEYHPPFWRVGKYPPNCSRSTLEKFFPTLYALDGNAPPERPQRLILNPFERLLSDYNKIYSGATVFVLPPTTAGINFVKGFELSYSGTDLNNGNDKGGPRCIVLRFTIDTLNATFRYTNFSVELYPLDSGLWVFTAYSLPTPPTEEDTTHMFRQSSLEVPQFGYSGSDASKYWHTSITYQVTYRDNDDKGAIFFSFIGSSVYDFLRYKVQLYRVNEEKPINETFIYKDKVPITPDHHDRLACHDEYGYPASCYVTSTLTITVEERTSSATTESSTLLSTHFTTPTKTTPTKTVLTLYPKDSFEKTIAAAIGGAIFALLICLAAFCMYKRRCKKYILKDNMDVTSRKHTVCLLYNVVNNHHDYAVQKLFDYLRSKFDLTVIVIRCTAQNQDHNPSFCKSLEKSFLVIFITSPESEGSLSNTVQSFYQGFMNTQQNSVYMIRSKLIEVSFGYPAEIIENHNVDLHLNKFKLMSDIHKLIDHMSMSGLKPSETNAVDKKDQKSKLNDLEKAVRLAVHFYKEKHTVQLSCIQIRNITDHLPETSDSLYDEGQQRLGDSTQRRQLDSISDVFQTRRNFHATETESNVSGNCVINFWQTKHQSLIYEQSSVSNGFLAPSEAFSNNDVSTLVLQQEILDLNERNLLPEKQCDLLKRTSLEEAYVEQYDGECFSIGSGKSV
ncbi:hypothetical protein FSP39_005114 [Pinctada imbricata]|uniref:SEFIR domain-containing protein n=1 Tax=Pinctada imbricata TaxID=66713 RepID=A0AA89C9X5_PINIB|nr:hypothetical protein FSP39_005114 [Pinctada imbricata]